MRRFARVEGVLVEPVGHLWAAFSPATGETALLNDESASILELLESEPAGTDQICATLASDSGLPVSALVHLVEASWPKLVETGLIRELPSSSLTSPEQ